MSRRSASSSSTAARPDPRTYVGKGKLEELKRAYREAEAESAARRRRARPGQQRALEDALEARVVDRTQLILDIFAQHAVTAEGKLQVELAQLEYNLPRMRGMWKHLERLGGGVGDARPGRVAARDRPPPRAPPRSAAPAAARGPRAAARDAPQGAHARRDADRRARRVHERRQVDAAQRAHRRRRLGRGPALRDARPDDARVRARRARGTSSPTPSASSGACRTSSSRGSRRRSRRRSSPTSSSTSSTARCPRTGSPSRSTRSRTVLAEIGAGEIPVELVVNKIDRLDPLARRRLANRFPGALRSRRRRGRGSRG